jgi:hypothetical protein
MAGLQKKRGMGGRKNTGHRDYCGIDIMCILLYNTYENSDMFKGIVFPSSGCTPKVQMILKKA